MKTFSTLAGSTNAVMAGFKVENTEGSGIKKAEFGFMPLRQRVHRARSRKGWGDASLEPAWGGRSC